MPICGKPLETKAKFIAQVMSGDMTVRRLEDMDSAALTYAEVQAIASGNQLVIEKAQVDAELIRLTRLPLRPCGRAISHPQQPAPFARGGREMDGTAGKLAGGFEIAAGHVRR